MANFTCPFLNRWSLVFDLCKVEALEEQTRGPEVSFLKEFPLTILTWNTHTQNTELFHESSYSELVKIAMSLWGSIISLLSITLLTCFPTPQLLIHEDSWWLKLIWYFKETRWSVTFPLLKPLIRHAGVTTMWALGLLNWFNISICATDASSDSGGSPKHFYSDTADLTEGQIAIILN